MARSGRQARSQDGRLRIGDDWNAIRIIALSQNNPLKAIAEFVENSIDAGAAKVVITRGREHGDQYLQIADDGAGVPRDNAGLPDFRYVATHICDSIKSRLKTGGAQGLQGEFGIGLLSFWTVGENLSLSCAGDNGKSYVMHMRKGDPGYTVQQRRTLFPEPGTTLKIVPLLAGLKQLSGEKIQWYLASELRERIRQSSVQITIVDRVARKELRVEPREYNGQLLHQLPPVQTAYGEVYAELYLAGEEEDKHVGLYRHGTRVLADITELPLFQHAPWNVGVLQGILDATFLNLTPATRTGLVHDERLAALAEALLPLEAVLMERIEDQHRAEKARASREMLRTLHKAFREAMLILPAEEYDWLNISDRGAGSGGKPVMSGSTSSAAGGNGATAASDGGSAQTPPKQFFEFAGTLHSVRIAPASCVLPVGQSRTLRAVCRDRNKRTVEDRLSFDWVILEGSGLLENADGEIVTYTAPAEPCLIRIGTHVTWQDVTCSAEALITVTDSLLAETREPAANRKGLPGYTFEHAAGRLWRSRFDSEQNVIVINNGHRDFVYSSKSKALRLRYIGRLYAKELVLSNFPGVAPDQLLERLIELSLYMEENLK